MKKVSDQLENRFAENTIRWKSEYEKSGDDVDKILYTTSRHFLAHVIAYNKGLLCGDQVPVSSTDSK